MHLPLEGIRVLDLSRVLAGPFCSQLLADFGAEVIKVEDPEGGDPGRWYPPMIKEKSALFYTVNRNKKSISINLKKEEGKHIFKQLVSKSDVIIDQFKPGVMDNLGLGYEQLKQINPGIIYCALSGYGLTGPMRESAGHDLTFQSMAGVTDLTGNKNGMPAISAVQIASVPGGSVYAALAVLMALFHREKTGEGQLCDVAMVDGSVSFLAYALGEWAGMGSLPQRGNQGLTGGFACYNIYPAKDRKYVSLAAVENKFWKEFCDKIGYSEYISFQWDPSRQDEMINNIKNVMQEKERNEWLEIFSGSRVCLAPVLNMEEMCQHPQIIERQMIHKLENIEESGKDISLTGIPFKLSATPGKIKFSFPELGQHNEEVLQFLGYTARDIKQFREAGII